MRLIRRDEKGDAVGVEIPLLLIGGLLMLAILGAGGAAVVNKARAVPSPVEARMGPSRNYVSMPELTIPVGGGTGREMDLKLTLEFEPGIKNDVLTPFESRISDRLGDRVRELGIDRLGGTEGAKLLKSAVTSVIDRELRPTRVRDVLIEKMVVR